jgi:hypothetical protein
MKLNIRINVFVRRYAHAWGEKKVNKTNIKPNTRDGLKSAAVSKRPVTFPDVARCISTAKPSSGKTAAVWSRAGEYLEEDFLYLFTLSNVSHTGILINTFI